MNLILYKLRVIYVNIAYINKYITYFMHWIIQDTIEECEKDAVSSELKGDFKTATTIRAELDAAFIGGISSCFIGPALGILTHNFTGSSFLSIVVGATALLTSGALLQKAAFSILQRANSQEKVDGTQEFIENKQTASNNELKNRF